MTEITFKIDWLAITGWGLPSYALELWQEWLSDYLGDPVPMGFGGRGYKSIGKSLAGAKLYTQPANEGNHFHIELPASACDAIPPEQMSRMMQYLAEQEEPENHRFRVTRLDLAWDGVNFTPQDFLEAVENDYIRTLAKRETTRVEQSPMTEKEDGSLGTTTIYLGSRTSTRSIRVYDKRGFTRVELEIRQERADQIARLLLVELPQKWSELGIAHLRDYIDVFENDEKENLAPWWEELVTGIVRANLKVSDAADIELVRLQRWMVTQVAPALSVLMDTVGLRVLESYVAYGRHKRGDRYKHLLENIKPEPPFRMQQSQLAM
ncbi:MAG: hypothetical protein DWQ07_19920 [Chloroflexi bacterium]|nr:MAG: hypothetical protein DWQ07_19920 [Chloroflexota bacterium]MBL1194351.1 hypothetical protein [Chloroflexota bacterium]NOH11641.1 hypothetical protein [Chloroflexota bacterium]